MPSATPLTPADRPMLIVAEGLLTYLEPDAVPGPARTSRAASIVP